MNLKISRRNVLAGLAGTLALPAGLRARASESAPSGPFLHGIASGDPDHDSVVLWTRVSVKSNHQSCRWEVASEPDFSQVRAKGEVVTDANRDFTVKVLAKNLEPGRTWYYRFHCGDHTSPTGRTRTLPVGSVTRLGLAVVSCSNYPFGYFNAYEAIALDPAVDYVLHLGDYLYEYGPDSYGGDVGRQLGRQHQPAHEIVTLADYRTRHAQYKSDRQSQAMHAAHPLIPLWDDHESTNNPWTGGAENHQPEQEGEWPPRRSASLQAWYEWMPVRDPAQGADPAAYWRHYEFGDLASLITLETRHTGRSQQIELAPEKLQNMDSAEARQFMREIVGAPDRHMLAPAMQAFAARALRQSVAQKRPWRLIGNQIPMARTLSPRLSAEDLGRLQSMLSTENYQRARYYARLGELGLPLYLDPWDGYPRARQQFYNMARDAGASDLLVLTGDSHSFWQNTLHDDAGRPMGIELGTSGTTSPGDFLAFGRTGASLMDQRLMDSNPEVVWTDGLHNGYLRLQLTPQAASADFIAVSEIRSRQYQLQALRQVTITREQGLLQVTAPAPAVGTTVRKGPAQTTG